jgi:catechol 2,3-dioxygenase-like lactoylglutathione lyase family enzyme
VNLDLPGVPSRLPAVGLDLGRPAHVGHIVADLDQAMARYTAELGLHFAEPVSYGRRPYTSRFTCSTGGPVTVELIQEVPGTLWTVESGSPVHHLAYWVDDFAQQVQALAERGLRLEASGPTFAYLRSDLGLRIELMDRSLEPDWTRWLAGGRLFPT